MNPVEVLRELNIEIFERFNECEYTFSYQTDGFQELIYFKDIILWYSEDDGYPDNLLEFVKLNYLKLIERLSKINFNKVNN